MLDAIDAFGHLVVAFAQLRTGVAAGGEHRVVAHETPRCIRSRTRPHRQPVFALEHQQRDLLRRIRDACAREMRRHPLACVRTITRDDIRNAARTGHAQQQRIPDAASEDVERTAAGQQQQHGNHNHSFAQETLRLQACV
jgi:hypothetical protein